jgi:hypothetical protein
MGSKDPDDIKYHSENNSKNPRKDAHIIQNPYISHCSYSVVNRRPPRARSQDAQRPRLVLFSPHITRLPAKSTRSTRVCRCRGWDCCCGYEMDGEEGVSGGCDGGTLDVGSGDSSFLFFLKSLCL